MPTSTTSLALALLLLPADVARAAVVVGGATVLAACWGAVVDEDLSLEMGVTARQLAAARLAPGLIHSLTLNDALALAGAPGVGFGNYLDMDGWPHNRTTINRVSSGNRRDLALAFAAVRRLWSGSDVFAEQCPAM